MHRGIRLGRDNRKPHLDDNGIGTWHNVSSPCIEVQEGRIMTCKKENFQEATENVVGGVLMNPENTRFPEMMEGYGVVWS